MVDEDAITAEVSPRTPPEMEARQGAHLRNVGCTLEPHDSTTRSCSMIDGFEVDSSSPLPTLERWLGPAMSRRIAIVPSPKDRNGFLHILREETPLTSAKPVGATTSAKPEGAALVAPTRRNPLYPWLSPKPPPARAAPRFIFSPSSFTSLKGKL